jgi:hypothetical protein
MALDVAKMVLLSEFCQFAGFEEVFEYRFLILDRC